MPIGTLNLQFEDDSLDALMMLAEAFDRLATAINAATGTGDLISVVVNNRLTLEGMTDDELTR